MKTKNCKYLLIAFVAAAMTSCGFFNKETDTFSQSDLHGLWLEEGTQHYKRFLTEKADTSTYEWGKEWNIDDRVYEERLVDYGNGWFKYQLKNNQLEEIHMMDNGGVEGTQLYVVTLLNANRLEYYKSGYKNDKHYFNKQ